MFATSRSRPIPDRLRGAGLGMVIGTLIWVLMPVALALGANASSGIGVFLLGSEDPLVVTPAMLPWLTPLSLVTTASGLLLYYGRAVRFGLAVALVWVTIGLVVAPQLAVVAGFAAFCIFTGNRRLQSGAPVYTS